MGDGPLRLNIGCGTVRPVGWVNVDPYPGGDPGAVIVADPLTRLPFDDATFDGAVAHHVLQMIGWPDIVVWLREVRRVMKPGAIFRVSVPDLLGAFDAYDEAQDETWFPIDDTVASSLDAKFCLYLSQCGATRLVFTDDWLCGLMEEAGFEIEGIRDGCARTGPLVELDSRLVESLYVEGRA